MTTALRYKIFLPVNYSINPPRRLRSRCQCCCANGLGWTTSPFSCREARSSGRRGRRGEERQVIDQKFYLMIALFIVGRRKSPKQKIPTDPAAETLRSGGRAAGEGFLFSDY
jgi:hypothetical protein